MQQLRTLFTTTEYDRLVHWLRGQTMALCDAQRYNHTTGTYETRCEGVPHGMVTYSKNVARFVLGLPVID